MLLFIENRAKLLAKSEGILKILSILNKRLRIVDKQQILLIKLSLLTDYLTFGTYESDTTFLVSAATGRIGPIIL